MSNIIKNYKSFETQKSYLTFVKAALRGLISKNEELRNLGIEYILHDYILNYGTRPTLCIYHDDLSLLEVNVSEGDAGEDEKYRINVQYSPWHRAHSIKDLSYNEVLVKLEELLTPITLGIDSFYSKVVASEIINNIYDFCRGSSYETYILDNKIFVKDIEFIRIVHISKEDFVIKTINARYVHKLNSNGSAEDKLKKIMKFMRNIDNSIIEKYSNLIAFLDICKQVPEMTVRQEFASFNTPASIYGILNKQKVIKFEAVDITIMGQCLYFSDMDYNKLFFLLNGLKTMSNS